MKGTLLGFDPSIDTGAIAGHDGHRYNFTGQDWRSSGAPCAGEDVDFDIKAGQATAVYRLRLARAEFRWSNFLLSFNGRACRSQYWLFYVLPSLIIGVVVAFLDAAIASGSGTLSSLYALIALWPSLAVGVKRCHDRDMSGWWLLLLLIPLVGAIWGFIVLGCLRGTVGDNRFGPDPT